MFCLAYMLHSSTVRELIIKNNSPAASAHSTKSDDAIHILAISLNFAPLVLFLYGDDGSVLEKRKLQLKKQGFSFKTIGFL